MPQATALAPAPAPAARTRGGGSEFSPLLRLVKGQGLLDHRPGWYARDIAVTLLGLVAVAAVLLLAGPTWWSVLLAVPLALLSARAAFTAHDAGHAQIT